MIARLSAHPVSSAVAATMLLASVAVSAQPARQGSANVDPVRAPQPAALQDQVETLQRQVAEQQELLKKLRSALGEQDERYQQLQRSVQTLQGQQSAQPPAVVQRPPETRGAPSSTSAAREPVPEVAPDTRPSVRVGTAPAAAEAPRAVAPLFEQPGVLTPKGTGVIEPSLQYGYSSNNRVALVGYTVIPALLIGLVDVREVKRNTVTGAVAVRYGLTNRFEVEARLPYVYRSDSTVSREIFTGSATESAFTASGKAIGDFDVTGRYQLNDGGADRPYLIGSLRVKTRTGRDPFEVVTDCQTRCVSNTTGTGQPLQLPTGSGFYTIQPGLTWLYPSDPAVFFGGFSYGYNVKRTGVSRQVLGGEREFIGDIKPGDVIGMNVGMGLALNERSSFSIGIDLNSIGKTRQNGVAVPGSVRMQLSTLLLGYSHRYAINRSINVSAGAGLTRDTPDLTLTVRVPFTF